MCLSLREVLPANSCITAFFDTSPSDPDIIIDGETEVPCQAEEMIMDTSETKNIVLLLGANSKSKEDIIAALPQLTAVEVNAIETATIGQSTNDRWKHERKGRITASNFYSVFTRVNTIKSNPNQVHNVDVILKNVMQYDEENASLEHVPALKHGRSYEPVARQRYVSMMEKQHKQFTFRECGLCVDANRPYLGASPDLLISCNCCGQGVAEFKCPFSIAQEVPSAENLHYLVKSGTFTKLRKNHAYYAQVQGQFSLCRRTYCDFFVYTHAGHFVERIDFDDVYWCSISNNLEYFFLNYLADELVSGNRSI